MANDAEQRWKTICRDWGIEVSDAQALKSDEALGELTTCLTDDEEVLTVALRATQVLLSDPEDPRTRERKSLASLYEWFSEEAWSHAGVGERAPWVLQGLLVAAWPEGSATASNTAVLLDQAWLARHGPKRQYESLEGWRERLASSTILLRPVKKANPAAELRTSSQEVRNAMANLVNKRNDALTFDVFGPSLATVLDAIWKDLISIEENATWKVFLKKQADNIQYIRENQSAQGWTLNHFISQLNAIVDIFSSIAHAHSSRIHWQSVGFFAAQAQRPQAHQYNAYSYPLIDLLSNSIEGIRTRAERRETPPATDNNTTESDLLWWGQASYSHLLRKSLRKLHNPSAIALVAAIEIAERSGTLAPDPTAAFLVQTLANLRIDVYEEKTLAEWMQELHDASNEPELRRSLTTMNASLAELVDDDPLGLPVSFVRRLAENNQPFDREEAEERTSLDLDTTIDRGDWASWLFREWRLDEIFGADR